VRNARKYSILTTLTLILVLLLVGNCFREPFRMSNKADAQEEEYVFKGAKTYATNCVQCHGPQGEGVIGMPLNRKDFKVRYDTPAGKDQYALITKTLENGRAASTIPHWVKAPDNIHFMSYTTMPVWGKVNGGPLDDDYIKALALFLMKPDGSQWNMVGPLIPEATLLKPGDPGPLPLPTSENADVNAAGQALLRNTAKTLCLTCHTIGSKGGKVGPDLTHVGSWGVDQNFLENWIKYANVPAANAVDKTPAIPHDLRMPTFWSANRATAQPSLDLTTPRVSEGPYFMPRFKNGLPTDRMTDQEIATIAKYLMGLK
jgi:mono/diheme cytochrome c family protein